ncbi:MAG: hypothetical protein IPL61_18750 [Myxococcales bacterium]|nr:hypothetical protein [Myxococcales bacterium]
MPRVGQALARLDASAFCRLMIAAQAIVDMHATTDPEAVFDGAVAILDASNGGGLPS